MLLLLVLIFYGIFAASVPLLSMLVPIITIACILIGTVVVLVLRIREINKGEELEAMKY